MFDKLFKFAIIKVKNIVNNDNIVLYTYNNVSTLGSRGKK